ncbi:MAG: D-glycero-beta-D-manno-heptose 1,7-bisphosphate 7-phosphatase [Burkholderiales bacterium]
MKLVILDRDGVINFDSDKFIKRPEEWKPIPGALDAVAKLNHAGFHVVVATNQSGIGRGLFDMTMLNAINEKMIVALGQIGGRLDAVFYCPHAAETDCACRKPKTGMFEEIGQRFHAPLRGIPSVGDSLRDLQASAAVGAQSILVLTGKGEKTLATGGLPDNTSVYQNLAAAVKAIIQSAL